MPSSVPRLAPRVALAAVLLGLAACQGTPQPAAIDVLTPCQGADAPTDALCGRLDVFENRAARAGRRISLKIVVLPALSPDPAPDPLVFLAGGPGQGAAKLAREVRELFGRIQADRDIVLVDQRGTGESNPLDCRSDEDSLAALSEPDDVGLQRLKQCLAGYDADPRYYTTTIAMDDLDEVRAHLGYARINIYGGSYGTRAGLVYLRQHGERVHARSCSMASRPPTCASRSISRGTLSGPSTTCSPIARPIRPAPRSFRVSTIAYGRCSTTSSEIHLPSVSCIREPGWPKRSASTRPSSPTSCSARCIRH